MLKVLIKPPIKVKSFGLLKPKDGVFVVIFRKINSLFKKIEEDIKSIQFTSYVLLRRPYH